MAGAEQGAVLVHARWTAEHPSPALCSPWVILHTNLQQSDSAQTGLVVQVTEHLMVGSVLSYHSIQRVRNEYLSIVVRNVPLIWAWQMLSVVI